MVSHFESLDAKPIRRGSITKNIFKKSLEKQSQKSSTIKPDNCFENVRSIFIENVRLTNTYQARMTERKK